MRKWLWIGLGLICILYGISIFMLRSGSKFYQVWIALGGGFLILAAANHYQLWQKLPKAFRAGGILLLVLVIGSLAAAEFCVLKHFHDRGEPGLDVIIVLGAQVWPEGPSASLKYRLDAALEYLNQNPDTRCIVSGGQGYNEPWSEAQGMYDYLTQNGLPAERIRMEDRSVNTVENIRYSMKMLDPEEDKVGIVTNNFHVFRGVALARSQGIRQVQGIAASSHPVYLVSNMFREYFGIAKDLLKGNIR